MTSGAGRPPACCSPLGRHGRQRNAREFEVRLRIKGQVCSSGALEVWGRTYNSNNGAQVAQWRGRLAMSFPRSVGSNIRAGGDTGRSISIVCPLSPRRPREYTIGGCLFWELRQISFQVAYLLTNQEQEKQHVTCWKLHKIIGRRTGLWFGGPFGTLALLLPEADTEVDIPCTFGN